MGLEKLRRGNRHRTFQSPRPALVFEVTEKPGTGISFVDAVRILACTEATNPKQISPRNSSRTNCTDEEMLDQIR